MEANLDAVESLVATIQGINPLAVAAISGVPEADPGSGVFVIAEVAGQKAGEADGAALAIRRLVHEKMGVVPERVQLVRPGWMPRAGSKAEIRRSVSEKMASSSQRRLLERSIQIGSQQENLDEASLELFASFGANSRIRTPFEASGPANMHIGSWVSLGRYGKILILDDFSALPGHIHQHYPEVSFNPRAVPFSRRFPTVVLRDGATLGDFFFIAATCRIEIGQHVVTSQRLFLTDCGHVFDDPRLPVKVQGNTEGAPLIIEDGCWLGIGVSVIKGVTIGKHSVIGTHSVVNRDVPAFAIAAGNPARVIRMQDPSATPSTVLARPFSRSVVNQAVRSLIESNVGHVLALDLDLRNDGLLTETVENALQEQISANFAVAAPAIKNAIDSSRTLRDLGDRIHACLLRAT